MLERVRGVEVRADRLGVVVEQVSCSFGFGKGQERSFEF